MSIRPLLSLTLASAMLGAATVSDDFAGEGILLSGGRTIWAAPANPAVSVVEAEGKAVLTVTAKPYAEANLTSAQPLPECDFLTAAVRISLRGLLFASENQKPAQTVLRVGLCSEPGKLFFNSADAIALRVDGAGAWRLGYKLDKPDANPESTTVLKNGTWTQMPERLDLILSPTGWAVEATVAGAVQRSEGTWPADKAPTRETWGASSVLRLHCQRAAKEAVDGAVARISIDHLVAGADAEAKP